MDTIDGGGNGGGSGGGGADCSIKAAGPLLIDDDDNEALCTGSLLMGGCERIGGGMRFSAETGEDDADCEFTVCSFCF